MKNECIFKQIGYIRSDFKEKFGIPRQSGRAPSLTAEIVLYPEYQTMEAVRGLEGFSHIWLLFDFSLAHRKEFSPTVRPPRLGGNKRVGVFASRSPFRPNPIGLSCVRFLGVEKKENGFVLLVSGADLFDNTPIYDIKPYLPFADCIPEATGGYASSQEHYRLKVDFPEPLLQKLPSDKQTGLLECLADDPRPSYQDDPTRIYGMRFANFEVKFKVDGQTMLVTDVQEV